MTKLRLVALASVLALSACNDDPVFLPLIGDTNPTDSGSDDTGGTDGGDVESDAAPDTDHDTTEPDVPESDVPESDVPEPDVWEPDLGPDAIPDADPPDAEPDIEPDLPPGPCVVGDECEDGGICAYEVEGCGFDPACVDLCPPTDPVNVCGCEGTVLREVPGCAFAEFAYVLDDTDQRAELEGADCDPTEFGRLRYSAELQFSDFDPFLGGTLHIRVPSNWDDSFVIEEAHPITAGTFELSFPNSLDTDLFGWFFEWYIDFDGNDRCDFEFEPSWARFVSNPFDAGPVRLEISAFEEFEPTTCQFWDES